MWKVQEVDVRIILLGSLKKWDRTWTGLFCYKYKPYTSIAKHNSNNEFIMVYSLYCLVQLYVSTLVMSHDQADSFS